MPRTQKRKRYGSLEKKKNPSDFLFATITNSQDGNASLLGAAPNNIDDYCPTPTATTQAPIRVAVNAQYVFVSKECTFVALLIRLVVFIYGSLCPHFRPSRSPSPRSNSVLGHQKMLQISSSD